MRIMELKSRLLTTLVLMLMGIGSAQAQGATDGVMDERFNEGVMPYGWFGKGWQVKDGVAKKGGGALDLGSLLGGGSQGASYLMTPPLQAQEGETLVFSARKSQGGMGSMMGSGDSTFVVEYEVYSEHRWKKAADFTTALSADYQAFSIPSPGTGEYRFRFKAAGDVDIDSVAGFRIDGEAPDIYVLRDSAEVSNVNWGMCMKDTTTQFNIINTATGTLQASVAVYDDSPFSVSESEVSVAAGDTVTVIAAFTYQNAKEGRNTSEISFAPADSRVNGLSYRMEVVKGETDVWEEKFEGGKMPEGWFTDGWQFKENTVSVIKPSDGMEGMMGGGSSPSYYLLTPVLTADSPQQVLAFSAKKTGSTGMGSLFGGGGSTFSIEKSEYGSNRWERVKDLTAEVDTVFTTLWVSEMQPGDYRFRFTASDSIVIDSIAGFKLKENAPDLCVTLGSKAVSQLHLGTLRADSTATFNVINTGGGTLQVTVSSSDEQKYTISEKTLSIAAGDTATVGVTYKYVEQDLGERTAVITFTPAGEVLAAQSVTISAYTIAANAWAEDFEPEYIVEDESQPLDLPAGWETTGWTVSKPGGDDMMSLFGGGGSSEHKSWMATTDSEEYELMTPWLQAEQGDVLQFLADMSSGGGMMAMFGGGGGGGQLNVYYSRDNDDSWVLYGTYTTTGIVHFKAPYTGVYRLMFKGSSVALDDFQGFGNPIEGVALEDGKDEQNKEVLDKYNAQKVNVDYDRLLSADENGDGTWAPRAYTICLPYDMDFKAYNEPGKIKLYSLQYVDRHYNHFIFKEVGDVASYGDAYLAVVYQGTVSLNGYGVELHSQPQEKADGETKVYDYEKWYFDKVQEPVGSWLGTFEKMAVDDEQAASNFSMTDEGSWVKVSSASEDVPGFRAVFVANAADATDPADEPDNTEPSTSRGNRAEKVGECYLTKFYQSSGDASATGDVTDIEGLQYSGDITHTDANTTGIRPTIHTIDADGSQRYYDLQGRLLKEKPRRGIYIENGVKKIK